MAYIDRDGVGIYYEEHGNGPAVLLSHGYSATSRIFSGGTYDLAKPFNIDTLVDKLLLFANGRRLAA